MKLSDSPARLKILIGKIHSLVCDIEKTFEKYEPEINLDSLSLGQLESKNWDIQILADIQRRPIIDYGIVFVLCGWYGVLPAMMFYSNLAINKIRSFDIDENCFEIADSINKTNCSKGWRFKAITEDIFKIDFTSHTWQMWSKLNDRMSYPITDSPDTIINTSCEHTSPDWFYNVPEDKLMVLQSNNFFEEEGHTNCVKSVEELKDMFPLGEIYYDGTFNLEKYSRFMLVGIK